jgi:hypothetical protein
MTAFVDTKGVRRREYKAVTTTETDILGPIKDRVTKTLESVHVICTGGGSTLTIRVKAGATLRYPLVNGATFSDDAHMTGLDIPLMQGESVTVQAGANDKLYVIIVTIDDAGTKDGRQ